MFLDSRVPLIFMIPCSPGAGTESVFSTSTALVSSTGTPEFSPRVGLLLEDEARKSEASTADA